MRQSQRLTAMNVVYHCALIWLAMGKITFVYAMRKEAGQVGLSGWLYVIDQEENLPVDDER